MGDRRDAVGARRVTASRARLDVHACGGDARWRAACEAPQRWVVRRDGAHVDAVHQLLGDGIFAGDAHRLRLTAAPGTHVTVRGLAATPLRPGARSAMATSITVAAGAFVLSLPGALIPQRGSDHASSLRADVADGGAAVLATVVAPGRTAMGERCAFAQLRLRTWLLQAGRVAFAEDATLAGGPAARSLFDGFDVALTVFALGATPAADVDWWRELAPGGVTGGATRLRSGGAAFRALCPTLGRAQELLARLEDRLA